MHMTIEERIKMYLLIEKMHQHKAYSEKLGLEDMSKFHGKRIEGKEERKTCSHYCLLS